MILRSIFDHDGDTVQNCLDIIERGMRRLGINPNAPMTRMAARTLSDPHVADEQEKAKARALYKRGGYELSEHQVARMAELAAGGKTQAEIALEIGCTQSTVAKRLNRLGIRKRWRVVS